MSISIRTNINAISTARQLGSAQEKVDLSMQRLSTGLRVNRAADDAAGLAISEKLKSQINGLNQAARNAKDAISLVQTAEGALGELGNMLQRMRTLALQSVNDVNSVTERTSLQKEVSQLQTEITRLSGATEFNGQKLLDGSFQSRRFQVGANSGQEITMSIGGVDATRLGVNRVNTATGAGTMSAAVLSTPATLTANNLAAQTLNVTGTNGTANVTLTAGQSARAVAEAVNLQNGATNVGARAETALQFTLGASLIPVNVSFTLAGDKSGGQTTLANITDRTTITAQVESSNDLSALAAAINEQTAKTGIQARIGDNKSQLIIFADDGRDVVLSGFTGSNATATVNATIQGLGANSLETTPSIPYVNSGASIALAGNGSAAARVGGFLKFESTSGVNITTTVATSLFAAANANSTLFDVANISVGDVDAASGAISILDGAIQQVNDLRATLGATQNRLQSTIANLESSSENLQFSNARIRDVDVAMESSELARAQVLMQAGVSVLAQANQQPQMALKLLGG
ncbi:MAG: flagellin [Deltaproteobacteria bacterium]|nr:flagellin [Planctomycetota bacterium]MBM4279544.1 flagellin [Deltaproteobacteria bacterium]